MQVEAVYAGLGTEADFMGKDVRGKAVFVYGMLGLPDEGCRSARVQARGCQGRSRDLRRLDAARKHAL